MEIFGVCYMRTVTTTIHYLQHRSLDSIMYSHRVIFPHERILGAVNDQRWARYLFDRS